MAKYKVTLYRVNESLHQPSKETFEADGVETHEDGSLSFSGGEGAKTFGPTTWGSFTFVRVSGSDTRE